MDPRNHTQNNISMPYTRFAQLGVQLKNEYILQTLFSSRLVFANFFARSFPSGPIKISAHIRNHTIVKSRTFSFR
jgi:hypothetical protein